MEAFDFNLAHRSDPSSRRKYSNILTGEEGDYVERTHNGQVLKVINFDNEKFAPKTGTVMLEPSKYRWGTNTGSQAKVKINFNNKTWRMTRDSKSDICVGKLLGFDPKTGYPRWEKLKLEETEYLDLSNPLDRIKYICVKFSVFFEDSPNFRESNNSTYREVNPEEDAQKFLIQLNKEDDAVAIAKSLVPGSEELNNVALALNFDPTHMSPMILYAEIIKYARDPEKVGGLTGAERFLQVYNGSELHERSILRRGIMTGVVIEEYGKGYHYNGVSMGYNEQEAVLFLKKSPTVLTSIDLLSKRIQEDGKRATLNNTQPVKPKTPESAEIENLKKQLDEMREKLMDSNHKLLEKESTEKMAESDPELADLLERGKKLKKGFHFIGKNIKDLEERKALLRTELDKLEKAAKN